MRKSVIVILSLICIIVNAQGKSNANNSSETLKHISYENKARFLNANAIKESYSNGTINKELQTNEQNNNKITTDFSEDYTQLGDLPMGYEMPWEGRC